MLTHDIINAIEACPHAIATVAALAPESNRKVSMKLRLLVTTFGFAP
jgi:hypothetical protein